MRGLRQDGLRHVCEGRTTVEEVLRVTKDETSSVSLPEDEVGGEAQVSVPDQTELEQMDKDGE